MIRHLLGHDSGRPGFGAAPSSSSAPATVIDPNSLADDRHVGRMVTGLRLSRESVLGGAGIHRHRDSFRSDALTDGAVRKILAQRLYYFIRRPTRAEIVNSSNDAASGRNVDCISEPHRHAQHPAILDPDVQQRFPVLGRLSASRAGGYATAGAWRYFEHEGERGYGRSLHRHLKDEETFLVLDGELRVHVGGQTRAGAGGMAFLPRHPHALVVPAAGPVSHLTPAPRPSTASRSRRESPTTPADQAAR